MIQPSPYTFRLLFGLLVALVPLSCSTDGRGLGQMDAAGSGGGSQGAGSGGRTGSGGAPGTTSGGAPGTGSGGETGTSTGGATGTSSGGEAGTGSGGAVGTGGAIGSGTGGAATGGRTGSGGVASGGRVGTGGAANGGRAGTGGAATGGAATGGAASGGAGTGGRGMATGGSGPQPDCTKDSDCHLASTCCTCAAYGPPQDAPPACGSVCLPMLNKCTMDGLPPNTTAACVAGRCVAGFNCDASNVTCRMSPPNCMKGQVPGITAEGLCYTGSCVPATQCKSVTSCDDCDSTQACVTNQERTSSHHCVVIPTTCSGNANCNCLGQTSCVSPYTSCSNASGRAIMCGCPTC